jgi:Methyltransferase domain
MPSSSLVFFEKAIKIAVTDRPSSVLDCGFGWGKYSAVLREYLELVITDCYRREDWKIQIDGVEGFEPYIQDHQRAVFNNIFIKDLNDPLTLEWISQTDYDLYLTMDVLEHLDDWRKFLETLPKRGSIIATVPHGYYEQGAVFGNALEIHKHAILPEDFAPYFDEVETEQGKIFGYRRRK